MYIYIYIYIHVCIYIYIPLVQKHSSAQEASWELASEARRYHERASSLLTTYLSEST